MLELGIDEITLVLKLTPDIQDEITPYEWASVAESIIDVFAEKADFLKIFGSKHYADKAPNGYTVAYAYGDHNFYFAVAYHELQLRMGIIIKFSAKALDYYLEVSCLHVYEIIQKVRSEYYTGRLSRIDLTADYIDEGIDVTAIYQGFIDKKVGVFRKHPNTKNGNITYRRIDMKYQGFIKGDEIPTIYLGSAKSPSQLRIYDKKREQIELKGNKLDKAINCFDWVRFEGVFKDIFAHQLSEEIQNIDSVDEFENLIASTLIQKFSLMYIENGVVVCNTEYTQMLLDCISNNSFILRAPSSRNFELTKSLDYLLSGSGLISTLYKIQAIWGKDAVNDLLSFVAESVEKHKPNEDARYWLKKNLEGYKRNYPDFNSFMNDNLGAIL